MPPRPSSPRMSNPGTLGRDPGRGPVTGTRAEGGTLTGGSGGSASGHSNVPGTLSLTVGAVSGGADERGCSTGSGMVASPGRNDRPQTAVHYRTGSLRSQEKDD